MSMLKIIVAILVAAGIISAMPFILMVSALLLSNYNTETQTPKNKPKTSQVATSTVKQTSDIDCLDFLYKQTTDPFTKSRILSKKSVLTFYSGGSFQRKNSQDVHFSFRLDYLSLDLEENKVFFHFKHDSLFSDRKGQPLHSKISEINLRFYQSDKQINLKLEKDFVEKLPYPSAFSYFIDLNKNSDMIRDLISLQPTDGGSFLTIEAAQVKIVDVEEVFYTASIFNHSSGDEAIPSIKKAIYCSKNKPEISKEYILIDPK